jgi:hypothetical protein
MKKFDIAIRSRRKFFDQVRATNRLASLFRCPGGKCAPVRAGTCPLFDSLCQPVIALGDAQIPNDRIRNGRNPIHFIY